MAEVLSRSLGELEQLRKRHAQPGTLVAIVSHGDVLRMLITHALGMPSDFIHRLELSPASVTVLEVRTTARDSSCSMRPATGPPKSKS